MKEKIVQQRSEACYGLLYENAVEKLRKTGITVVSEEHYNTAVENAFKKVHGRESWGPDEFEDTIREACWELAKSVEELVGFKVWIYYSRGDVANLEPNLWIIKRAEVEEVM